MKTQVKAFLRFFLSKNIIWIPINKLGEIITQLFQTFTYYRTVTKEQEKINKRREKKCKELFRDLVVLNGPFKGMKYPKMKAAGSEVYPKLLGSYEKEISEALEYVLAQNYTSVVDIGCGEGYYAVGLGMKSKDSLNFAFDTDPRAVALCKKMAALNGVKIKVGGRCTAKELKKLPLGKKALIFSDCEGYELELLDQDLCEFLKPHDLIIETHDLFDITITQTLLENLNRTHHTKIFHSVEDREKAYTYEYPELDGLDLNEKYTVLKERGQIMKWIFAKTKSDQLRWQFS